MAGDVVELLRYISRANPYSGNRISPEDAKAVLAVVEAATFVSEQTWFRIRSEARAKMLSDSLARLYAGSSGETE